MTSLFVLELSKQSNTCTDDVERMEDDMDVSPDLIQVNATMKEVI